MSFSSFKRFDIWQPIEGIKATTPGCAVGALQVDGGLWEVFETWQDEDKAPHHIHKTRAWIWRTTETESPETRFRVLDSWPKHGSFDPGTYPTLGTLLYGEAATLDGALGILRGLPQCQSCGAFKQLRDSCPNGCPGGLDEDERAELKEEIALLEGENSELRKKLHNLRDQITKALGGAL
jgi:hypothetical protein